MALPSMYVFPTTRPSDAVRRRTRVDDERGGSWPCRCERGSLSSCEAAVVDELSRRIGVDVSPGMDPLDKIVSELESLIVVVVVVVQVLHVALWAGFVRKPVEDSTGLRTARRWSIRLTTCVSFGSFTLVGVRPRQSLRLITCARVMTRVIRPDKRTLVEPSLRRPHFGS